MENTITIKIGSTVLLTQRCKIDEFRISHIATQVASLKALGYFVVLVVSGAVACGSQYIKIQSQEHKQASAGMGQIILINTLHGIFASKKLLIAQIVCTFSDLQDTKKRYALAQTLNIYKHAGIVPCINENDVIELNSFGGNDFLACEIAKLTKSVQMIMLSSYKTSGFGVGGGDSKRQVQLNLESHNIVADIRDGKVKNVLLQKLP